MRAPLFVLPIFAACSTGGDAGSALITAADGGTVSFGGAEVVVPAGALAEDVTITITPVETGLPAFPEGITASGTAFAFTPHGTTFSALVTLTLPFDGAADTVLRLDDEADTTWDVVEATFGTGTATVETSTFSIYVVTSACTSICQHAETVCGATGGIGACESQCATGSLRPTAGCLAEAAAVRACYLKANTAADFDCAGDLLPVSATCAAEVAAAATCVNGGTTTTCPCFDATDLAAAATDARTYVTPTIVFSQECTVSKDFNPANFGDVTTVNSIVIQSRDPDAESYFAWFSAGPMQINPSPASPVPTCMIWAGDSNPANSFPGVPLDGSPPAAPLFSSPITAAELAQCIADLQAYRSSNPADLSTCVEQH